MWLWDKRIVCCRLFDDDISDAWLCSIKRDRIIVCDQLESIHEEAVPF